MRSYIVATVLFSVVVASIFGYMREIIWFQNTINRGDMLLKLAAFGAAFGLLLGVVLKLLWQKKDTVEVIQLFAGCIFFTALLMPLLGSLYNRTFAEDVVNQEVTFVSEKAYYKSIGQMKGQEMPANGYYIRFLRDSDTVRVEVKSPKYPNKTAGETILMPTKKGALGYEVVMIE